jgi:hypothetical protein
MPGTNQPTPLPTALEGFRWMRKVAPIFNRPTVSRKKARNWKNSGHTGNGHCAYRLLACKGVEGIEWGVENVEGLSDGDREFLAVLGAGSTIAAAARTLGYSPHWGKWKSRSLRRRFGVETIWEAVAMAEDDGTGVSRADFEKLFGAFTKLSEAVDEMAKRPGEPAAQQAVTERQLDVKDHAKALGLSLDDVEKLKGEKRYEEFRSMQERLDAERAAADDEIEDDDDAGNGTGKGLGDVIRDGLGGIRKPS